MNYDLMIVTDLKQMQNRIIFVRIVAYSGQKEDINVVRNMKNIGH